jgi:hypothetical protein
MIFVFSYEREQMLKDLTAELKGENFLILDDGSSFHITEDMVRFPHEGKAGFYKKWQFAFKTAEATKDDFFLFIPSDFQNVQLDEIKRIHEGMKHQAYVYNVINDGREWCWIQKDPEPYNENTDKIYFTDCGFFCNRKALESINFKIRTVDPKRFKLSKDISSGVGQNLTMQFHTARVPIYMPKKSLAYHGDHQSVMHPEHRKKNPLISK